MLNREKRERRGYIIAERQEKKEGGRDIKKESVRRERERPECLKIERVVAVLEQRDGIIELPRLSERQTDETKDCFVCDISVRERVWGGGVCV